VASLRVKQDLVPGTVQRTRFHAEVPGKYEIACAELCGLGHYRMRGFLEVMAPAAFASWEAEQTPWTENF
jgi:cytochrome c oxidase subunit 2